MAVTRLLRQFFFIPAATTTDTNCPDQLNRVFIITGGYTGVGFELSRILYAHNATVYVAGRSETKGIDAINRIRNSVSGSHGRIHFMFVDLSDLRTIKPAVEAFLAQEKRLDVLVNNAAVMFPADGSVDAHGNDLQVGTNCLGPYLLYQLLEPILQRTAASSPTASVRVTWAASVAIEVASPKPDGMVLKDDGQPMDKGIQLNYGQTKVGNLFFSRKFAQETPRNGILHVCFNPGNLKTELQRHWKGIAPWMAEILILHPPVKGAHTELYAAVSADVVQEPKGAYVVPWGRIGSVPPGIEMALKLPSDGGTGVAAKFLAWCEKQTTPFR